MLLRLLLVVVLGVIVAAVALRTRRPTAPDAANGHRVPDALVGRAERTWIVFATQYCASCGPVEAQLRERFPDHVVVRADVEQWAEVASDLGVRRAPTVVRVDSTGTVDLMLAGPEAVREHLGLATLAR